MIKTLRIIFYLILTFTLVHFGGKIQNAQKKTPNTEAQDTSAIVPKELESVQCIAGVYEGEIDARWEDRSLWALFGSTYDGYDATVSLAFSGNSLLVKVKGDEDDVLCTRYDGVIVYDNKYNKLNYLYSPQLVTSTIMGAILAVIISNTTSLPMFIATATLITAFHFAVYSFNEDIMLLAQKITSNRFLIGSDEPPTNLAVSLTAPVGLYITENTCSFEIGSVDYRTGRSDKHSIEESNLIKSEQVADFDTLIDECGGEESFTHTLLDIKTQ